MKNQTLEIIHEIVIPAPRDQVWAFLLNEEKMKNWFNADQFVIDAMEGGEIEIPLSFDGEEITVLGEIGLVYPKEKFIFTWMERDQTGEIWFNNTSITIELDESRIGTYCRFKHDGFKYLPDDEREEIFKRYTLFWEEQRILQHLKSLIINE